MDERQERIQDAIQRRQQLIGSAQRAHLEIAAAARGLRATDRATTYLFGPDLGEPWYHSLIDRVFVFLLRNGAGLSPLQTQQYNMHSWRIYLACALYAAGCPNDRIMAMLRWRSEEALLIYARLNDNERAEWVHKSLGQRVDSTIAARLPRLDAYDSAAALQHALASGTLGAASCRAATDGE